VGRPGKIAGHRRERLPEGDLEISQSCAATVVIAANPASIAQVRLRDADEAGRFDF
jgi:hypothetical protein